VWVDVPRPAEGVDAGGYTLRMVNVTDNCLTFASGYCLDEITHLVDPFCYTLAIQSGTNSHDNNNSVVVIAVGASVGSLFIIAIMAFASWVVHFGVIPRGGLMRFYTGSKPPRCGPDTTIGETGCPFSPWSVIDHPVALFWVRGNWVVSYLISCTAWWVMCTAWWVMCTVWWAQCLI
jgi:hypothetical protein